MGALVDYDIIPWQWCQTLNLAEGVLSDLGTHLVTVEVLPVDDTETLTCILPDGQSEAKVTKQTPFSG